MAKVSIIIPVYNVERYLRECLDSVCRQTLQDLEVICLDDGSTDSCGRILDEYARMDGRFRIIHKPNEGYGKTMNAGIKLATAPYIGIVESDDRIAPDMYENLVQLMEEKQADILKADFYEFYERDAGNYIEEYVYLLPDESLHNLYGKIFNIHKNKMAFHSYLGTWSGLYSRRFLLKEHILYNETPGASYQDQGFWLQTMIKAKRIYLVKEAYYHYRIDNYGSSMYDKGKVFAVRGEYHYMRGILDSMREAGKEYYPWLNQLQIASCFNSMSRIADSQKELLAGCIRKDVLEASEAGELDASLFDQGQKAELFSLIVNPKAYSKKLIKRREQIERLLEGYSHVILYGAGKIGRRVQRLLKDGRLNTKIKSFAVTQKEQNPAVLAGIPVEQIDQLLEYRETALVIMCVGERYIAEVDTVLRKKGFENRMVYKQLFDERDKA